MTPAQLRHILDAATLDQRRRMSLADFFAASWSVLEPGTPLIWGPHLDAICDHVQALMEGWLAWRAGEPRPAVQNLLITVPPGSSKSRIASVCAPAWMWTRDPSWRVICLSKNPAVALRDARYSRLVVESPWFSSTFDTVSLRDDQNAKGNFETASGGVRQSMGFGAGITGSRADCIILDDPLDAKDRHSEQVREGINDAWDTAVSNRLNDLQSGLRIVIMQRLHERDLAGHLLSTQRGRWQHLMIPQEFEEQRRCRMWTGWTDWRTREGELMDPQRFPANVLDAERETLRAAGYAAQHQQRPSPEAGNVFHRSWFAKRWREPPPRIELLWISCDPANSDSPTSWVVIQLWAAMRGERFLLDQVRGRFSPRVTEQAILDAQARWGAKYGTIHAVLVEEKAAGPSVMERLRDVIPGVLGIIPRGSKEERARGVSPVVESGAVVIPDPQLPGMSWVGEWLEEMVGFPTAAHNDQVDAATQALNWAQARVAGTQLRNLNERVLGTGKRDSPWRLR